ncbi:MAG: hypothetical protein GKR91_04130 [Pseudomonadales bacterium]|nr:hypothetical protein [Pseudomonadales bacterium]
MKKATLVFTLTLSSLLSGHDARAQDFDLPDLQGNIEIFTGVLEDALDLNQGLGLFGMSVGGVNATYLYRQGVLIEVRTPLANQRNRLSLASLNSAMLSMQSGENPFQRLMQGATPLTSLSPQTNEEEASSFYNSMLERIAKVDYSLMVNNAIQQASDSARSLRALGDVDESDYEILRSVLDAMRERLQDNIDQINQIQADLRSAESSEQIADSSVESELSTRLDELIVSLEPLREQAIAKAAELREQTELAEQRYVQRWHEDVNDFERNLYVAMCNYGSTLRALPENESISVILKGLGEDEVNANRRPDKVHVLSKIDVQQCQSGEIDVAELESRSAQYSY